MEIRLLSHEAVVPETLNLGYRTNAHFEVVTDGEPESFYVASIYVDRGYFPPVRLTRDEITPEVIERYLNAMREKLVEHITRNSIQAGA